MIKSTKDHITVGHVQIPISTAADWVRDYTGVRNATASAPYAYPAYDLFSSTTNDPLLLSDGDFLAPVLLNVRLPIRSFYALQGIRGALEKGLANEDLALPLAEVEDPGRIAAMVQPLYEVLDDGGAKPWGVKGTTLSKVLHRKRPQSLVLHDLWVRACYVGEGGPVRPVPKGGRRSWAGYMTEVTQGIGHDIRTQQTNFDLLDKATGKPGELSHVRLLDILAWSSKGQTTAEDVEVTKPSRPVAPALKR